MRANGHGTVGIVTMLHIGNIANIAVGRLDTYKAGNSGTAELEHW